MIFEQLRQFRQTIDEYLGKAKFSGRKPNTARAMKVLRLAYVQTKHSVHPPNVTKLIAYSDAIESMNSARFAFVKHSVAGLGEI